MKRCPWSSQDEKEELSAYQNLGYSSIIHTPFTLHLNTKKTDDLISD